MGILNQLFGSTESIAKDMEKDDQAILKIWRDYLDTVPKKNVNNLQELRKLLELELIDIHKEERDEKELISDLEAVEHSKKVKRVHRLEQCLGYAETKHEYVHELLQHLYSILRHQMRLVDKLLAGSKNSEKLIAHLKSQLELELETIKKIEGIKTFHELFSVLVKGEHIIKTMDSREKRLLKKMQNGMSKIFTNEVKEGITYEWAMTVYDEVQDLVMDHEALLAKGYDPHDDVDFEFVNKPEFIELVRETIKNIRKREVSEQIINVFVHIFREWYNHGRD